MNRLKETDIAAKVVEYFNRGDWTVYQEVQTYYASPIADIVAVKGNRVWIVETKTSFSLNVLEQAYMWQYRADWVSVATPRPIKRGRDVIKTKLLDMLGLGHFEIDLDNPLEPCRLVHVPKLNRKIISIKDKLCEEQKVWAEAGNSRGERYTPFQRTCRELTWYIRNNPGCTIKEAIESIDHHYSNDASAKGSIFKWINQGTIKNIRVDYDKVPYRLYLKEAV